MPAVLWIAQHQRTYFRLWRTPCGAPPSPIREQESSVGRKRVPSGGSQSTTWMIVSNRSVCAHQHTGPCTFVHTETYFVCASTPGSALSVILPLLQGLKTTGALDLGGASTQISFISDDFDGSESPINSVNFRLYGNDYNLYTHSFLCYGKDQALKMVVANHTQVNFWPWFLCFVNELFKLIKYGILSERAIMFLNVQKYLGFIVLHLLHLTISLSLLVRCNNSIGSLFPLRLQWDKELLRPLWQPLCVRQETSGSSRKIWSHWERKLPRMPRSCQKCI